MVDHEKEIPLISRIESEVCAKYQELARRELEQRLQEEADKQGRLSPLKRNRSEQMPGEIPDN